MLFRSSSVIFTAFLPWSLAPWCLLQLECSLSSATTLSDCLAIYCVNAWISCLSSVFAFSALSLSSLMAWSLSFLIASMTLCSKSSIRCLREEKLLSIYSEFELNKSSSLSNSCETVPPTVLMMSTLTSPRSFDIENEPALWFMSYFWTLTMECRTSAIFCC